MIFRVLAITGLLLILLGILALWRNRSLAASGQAHPTWLFLRRWSWILCIALAIGSYFIIYPYKAESEVYKILGFPFMAAAFDEAGSDYVGPLTGIALIANAVFFFLLPHIALWLFYRRRSVA